MIVSWLDFVIIFIGRKDSLYSMINLAHQQDCDGPLNF